MKINVKTLGFASLLILLLSFTLSISLGKAEGAIIWTDKADYAPEEIVTIYGEGFQGIVTITVVRPDGTVNDPENGIVGEWIVDADENGRFETTYKLDGILGEYTVMATDEYGNTATTTFTDAINIKSVSSSDSGGNTKTSFLTTDNVYATVTYSGGSGSDTVDAYIVTSLPSGQNPTLSDVRGSPTTVTFDENHLTWSIWTAPITAGTYYIILDINQNGKWEKATEPESVSFTVKISVTFKQSGLDSSATGTVVYVDVGNDGSVDYSLTYSDLSSASGYSIGVASGTTVKCTYGSTVSDGSGKRFRLDYVDQDSTTVANPLTFTVSAATTITGHYVTQYMLTIQTSGLASASYPTNVKLGGSTVGTAYDSSLYTTWFDAGASTGTIGVDATVSGGTGTQFVFTKWNEDSSTDTPRASETMYGPKTFTAVYKTQYYVTFGWSGLAADASGKVVTITVGGSPVVKNADDSSYSEWLDAGTTLSYSFESLVGSSMPNKAYKLVSVAGTSTSTSHNFGPISGPISETGNYGSIILSISKKAPSAVFVGDTVRYVYEVENTGTTSATGIAVSDGSLTVSFVGGDANGNGKLDPKETWVYTATYGPVSATSSITNTAQVSCNEGAVAEDTATVDVY